MGLEYPNKNKSALIAKVQAFLASHKVLKIVSDFIKEDKYFCHLVLTEHQGTKYFVTLYIYRLNTHNYKYKLALTKELESSKYAVKKLVCDYNPKNIKNLGGIIVEQIENMLIEFTEKDNNQTDVSKTDS